MRRHRIFYLLPYFELAGTEMHLLELARGMIDRYDVIVGAPYGKGIELLQNFSIPYREFPLLTFGDIGTYKRFLKLILEEFSPDIIHIHGAHELVFIAKRLSPSTPVIFTCHGYGTRYPLIDYSLSAYICNRWADRVIAVSNYDRDFLIRRGLDLKNVSVIHNGVSEINEHLSLPISLKGLIIGTAARLTKVKGINYLIEAFSLLVKKYRDINLVILGDGEDRIELEELTNKLDISNRVYFLGSIPNARKYFINFDIFVLPSLMDFLPIAIIEALAMGRAIVATNVGGIPEIIEDGKMGILVPAGDSKVLADAIERLIVDRELREKVGENGYKRFKEEFTVEKMVEKTNEIYKSLI